MAICDRRDENYDNQMKLEEYLFGPEFNSDNLNLINDGKIIVVKTKSMTFNLNRVDKPIGEGTAGTVFKFIDNVNQVNIAVKITSSNNEEEIANQLRMSDCAVLHVRYVDGLKINNKFVYFMELAEGDLHDWARKMMDKYRNGIPRHILYSVCVSIWKQLDCLFELGRFYTDIKLENILFKCPLPNNIEEENVRFMLGDLESAVPVNGVLGATYPPYEYKNMRGLLPQYIYYSTVLTWGFGILVFSLLPSSEGVPPEIAKMAREFLNNRLFFSYFNDVTSDEISDVITAVNKYSFIDLQGLLTIIYDREEWRFPIYKEIEKSEDDTLSGMFKQLDRFPDENCAYRKVSLDDLKNYKNTCVRKDFLKLANSILKGDSAGKQAIQRMVNEIIADLKKQDLEQALGSSNDGDDDDIDDVDLSSLGL